MSLPDFLSPSYQSSPRRPAAPGVGIAAITLPLPIPSVASLGKLAAIVGDLHPY
ncbi:MAG: hypothetical protein WA996_11965 [Candidatus Promineifilaceae bacterium]